MSVDFDDIASSVAHIDEIIALISDARSLADAVVGQSAGGKSFVKDTAREDSPLHIVLFGLCPVTELFQGSG